MRLINKLLVPLLTLPCLSFSQAGIVLSGDAYINIENSANIVLDNGAATALSTSGAGGNILSESETNVIRWNIGTNTGSYTIPWTTPAGTKIPLSVTITSAGTGANGYLDLSTWKGNDWDNNTYRPSDVLNMSGSSIANNSANVIDRFWVIDHENYSSAPSASISFGYDEDERTATGNTIPQGVLGAQRYNSSTNEWIDSLSMGIDNYPTQIVSGISADANGFFRSWTLVNQGNPLPVNLTSFSAQAVDNEYVLLDWKVVADNSEYFTVERSREESGWNEIYQTPAIEDPLGLQTYNATDENPLRGVSYYRLRLTDQNGNHAYSKTRSVFIDPGGNLTLSVYPNPTTDIITIEGRESMLNQIRIVNLMGQDVTAEAVFLEHDRSRLKLSLARLSKGIYFINSKTTSIKIYKQ